MIFMLICSDIIFIQFWLKVVEKKKEQKKKIQKNTKFQ